MKHYGHVATAATEGLRFNDRSDLGSTIMYTDDGDMQWHIHGAPIERATFLRELAAKATALADLLADTSQPTGYVAPTLGGVA